MPEPDTAPQQSTTRTTRIARPWLIRMVVITAVLFAFGAWALYDATVAYPDRGRRVADYFKLEYLRTSAQAGRLFDAGVFDPRGDLDTLRAKDVLELSAQERAKRDWLDALAVPGLGMLDPEHTRIDDPQAEMERLTEELQTRSKPSELSTYDILMQWLILAICWGIGLWMLLLFITVASRKYAWDPATKTLALPGGRKLAPADLDPEEPADLTRWHKFIIFLKPRDGHPDGAAPIKLDLFRYQPLEDWVRELVKGANPAFEFPDEIDKDEAPEEEPEEEAPQQTGQPASEEVPGESNPPEAADEASESRGG